MAKKQAPRAVSGGPSKAVNGVGPAGDAKAPAFRLPRDGGGTVALADFAGRKLVLYFYPRADTSGCTREAIDFSRLKSAFSRAGTDIVGLSSDPVAALDRFKSKHKRARHVPGRPRSAYRTRVAQSVSCRPRARGARRSEDALSWQPDANH
jgi:peroxiredoxin